MEICSEERTKRYNNEKENQRPILINTMLRTISPTVLLCET
jgi:hypothetical protein